MINLKTITQAIETLLNNNLEGYLIERNAERNVDPNKAARGSGWIGIYRGNVKYEPHTTGSTPWRALIELKVEVQRASMQSGADAEDKLEDSVEAVMDVLTANKKLNNTVGTTVGYRIDYEFNSEEKIWHHAGIITITAETRA